MATALGILLWIVAAVLGLIVLILVLPVRVSLRLASGPRMDAGAEIRLLAGLAPPIRLSRPRHGAEATPESEAGSGHRRPDRRPKRVRRRGAAVAGRLLSAAPRALGRMVRKVHLERVEIDGDLGLGDPAETGALFGWLMPLIHTLPSPRFRLDLRPDFSAARISVRAEAAFRIIPAALLPPLAALLWAGFGARR